MVLTMLTTAKLTEKRNIGNIVIVNVVLKKLHNRCGIKNMLSIMLRSDSKRLT